MVEIKLDSIPEDIKKDAESMAMPLEDYIPYYLRFSSQQEQVEFGIDIEDDLLERLKTHSESDGITIEALIRKCLIYLVMHPKLLEDKKEDNS